jgi:hypothetical protein
LQNPDPCDGFESFLAGLVIAIAYTDELVPILFQQLLGAVLPRRKGSFDFHGMSLLNALIYWMYNDVMVGTASMIGEFLNNRLALNIPKARIDAPGHCTTLPMGSGSCYFVSCRTGIFDSQGTLVWHRPHPLPSKP